MRMVTLWKASRSAERGVYWAERRSDAEAYQDNPGFGGPRLFRAEVEPEYVLDLTRGDWRRIVAQALADDAEYVAATGAGDVHDIMDRMSGFVEPHRPFNAWENSPRVAAALARSYRWVRYIDDYPAGCVTWHVIDDTPVACEEVSE